MYPATNNVAFTAPHYAAAQAGQTILEQGGTAIEAMVAAAASIAVVYPHMNGMGGDGFWLISEPGKAPIAIDASGVAAQKANGEFYAGLNAIPERGGKAALTMAGAVAGWKKALEISATWQSALPLEVLLHSATGQAKWGIEVTQSLSDASHKTFDDLAGAEPFSQFLIKGGQLRKGKILKLPKLAETLEYLSHNGLDDFYQGDIASQLATDLQAAGSPLREADFGQYRVRMPAPLKSQTSFGQLYNFDAPTQGIASLLILSLYDRIKDQVTDEASYVHALVECTKQAFILRDKYVNDPDNLTRPLQSLLAPEHLDTLTHNISMQTSLPWPHVAKPGDTVWMGACDKDGRMVSYIQSLYWEFGSGVVSPSTGIVWNNRGIAFSLNSDDPRYLQPGKKPFHTLNPAYAELSDGRRMAYGTMGGEGQPQTQAVLFSRYLHQGMSLETAISRGRWLLGRTWGDQSHNLKIEADLADALGESLSQYGHDIAVVEARNEMMGHAGAIVRDQQGQTLAATDPRSDGKAFCDESGGIQA